MNEKTSKRTCNKCGKVKEIKPRQAKCPECIAELKRLERNTNLDVKDREKSRYAKVKDDPDFKRANNARASEWNKKNRKNHDR
jgi:hypothetical protein